MVIYTKKGDRGETSLFDAKRRVLKSSSYIRAVGSIDELNSYLGIILAHSKNISLNKILLLIQNNLFTINAILAGANLKLDNSEVRQLEMIVDNIERKLPILKNFILPGGSKISAELMYARTLARRAEREMVGVNFRNKPEILAYVNRLSDTLFMLARNQNFKSKFKEIIWQPKE
jgi:cob(I)alamin adenosyltransferase